MRLRFYTRDHYTGHPGDEDEWLLCWEEEDGTYRREPLDIVLAARLVEELALGIGKRVRRRGRES